MDRADGGRGARRVLICVVADEATTPLPVRLAVRHFTPGWLKHLTMSHRILDADTALLHWQVCPLCFAYLNRSCTGMPGLAILSNLSLSREACRSIGVRRAVSAWKEMPCDRSSRAYCLHRACFLMQYKNACGRADGEGSLLVWVI